ncbi:MAG: hypothetical protein M3Q56_06720 [Bacteroidota bacterium]|nr:hypothetical protein [Bacteroidota bacterium]
MHILLQTLRLKRMGREILIGIWVLLVMFSINSCSKKINFLTSSIVPAARGHVTVNKDKNQNYVIDMQLSNLAEVGRLTPSKQTYVVWMVTDQDMTKNIGQINSSSSLLSKTLKASFETVTSVKPSKIFITAEDDATTQYPGTQVVLTTNKF